MGERYDAAAIARKVDKCESLSKAAATLYACSDRQLKSGEKALLNTSIHFH